jgi:hypothetical protein
MAGYSQVEKADLYQKYRQELSGVYTIATPLKEFIVRLLNF